MKLKLDKPVKMWAYVQADGELTNAYLHFRRPTQASCCENETIERVLVTVTRVERGKRK